MTQDTLLEQSIGLDTFDISSTRYTSKDSINWIIRGLKQIEKEIRKIESWENKLSIDDFLISDKSDIPSGLNADLRSKYWNYGTVGASVTYSLMVDLLKDQIIKGELQKDLSGFGSDTIRSSNYFECVIFEKEIVMLTITNHERFMESFSFKSEEQLVYNEIDVQWQSGQSIIIGRQAFSVDYAGASYQFKVESRANRL